jgi:hypothetical protein
MRLILSTVVLIALAVVMSLERVYIESIPFAEEEISELTSIQTKQIDLFVEQSDLLTTLASGLLAALGALLLKSDSRPGWSEFVLLVIAVALTAASLYFGYLAYQEVMWMLHNRFFNLENPYIEWARRLQFFTFMSGACISLLFVSVWASGGSSREVS